MGGDGSRCWDVRGSYLGCGPCGRMGRARGYQQSVLSRLLWLREGRWAGGAQVAVWQV